MIEPKLKELSGASRLARGFFNSLIRRIECTKPLAGPGIQIAEGQDGIVISTSPGSSSTLSQKGLDIITLNVCSGGQIVPIQVYAPGNVTT